jgi:hypothetical protein
MPTPTLLKMPRYWMELDEGSIERAIAAIARELGWPNEREGSAEFLVAAVMKALETPAEQRTAVYGTEEDGR